MICPHKSTQLLYTMCYILRITGQFMIDKHNERNCSWLSLVVLCRVPDGACMSLRGASTGSTIDVTMLVVMHESKVKST